MQHVVLLGRDNWMYFTSRSYCSLPPRPSDERLFGELELFHHAPTGMSMYPIDPTASGGGFHVRYEGATGVTLSDDPQLLAVNLVRSDGYPALTGHYLVDMMPQPDLPSVEEHFVASGRQALPLVGVAALEPGDIQQASARLRQRQPDRAPGVVPWSPRRGAEREVHAPGSRGGGAWALSGCTVRFLGRQSCVLRGSQPLVL